MEDYQSLAFFWDMQNCSVSKQTASYEICSKIRRVVGADMKTKEVGFNAYVDVSSLNSNQRLELARARHNLLNNRVTLRDVPSSKQGAADIRLLQDILHHTMVNKSGIVVLISII